MTEPGATAYIDGGSRGNPGPAAYAVVLSRPGQPVIEVCDTIGSATNNVAEYTALVNALDIARGEGVSALAVFSDSELLVKQMTGAYRVKSPDLQDLYAEAQALRRQFEKVTFTHVRRELNKRADLLCNLALDGKSRPLGSPPFVDTPPHAAPAAKAPGGVVTDAAVRADALICLRSAAQAWAANGPSSPAPEAVWEQIWSVLEEGGVLKKKKPK